MKRQAMPDVKEGGVNVTPLIDIVMVMIVFFMLVAKIGVTRGVDENIPLPAAILGKSLDSFAGTLTLNVLPNKSSDEPIIHAMVDNQKRELHVMKEYRGGADQELERVLKAFRDQFKEQATVIVRADQDLEYRQLELVLLACSNAGIGHVTYETSQGRDALLTTAFAQ